MRADPIGMVISTGSTSGDMAGDLVFGTLKGNNLFQPLNLAQIYGYSIQANYLTGSPVGTLKLQSSNDNVNWCDIPGTSFAVSSTGSFMWNVSNSNYLYARLVFTHTGGSSGALTATAYIRGF